MAVLHFEYRMEIDYEEYINKCFFTIKCIPRENARQHLLGMKLCVFPETEYSFGTDSFGNRQIYGCEREPHRQFVFRASGDVEVFRTGYEEDEDRMTGVFRVPHGKCVPACGLLEYYRTHDFSKCKSRYEICTALMHRLHQDFSYVPGATHVQTTAEEAWALREGVCQDYAHIYITLLRLAGIPARYVCGMIIGEGASHAWAEAFCDGKWSAFDPTNDCPASENYIKLGHGRDAADCAINRGLMWSAKKQSQKISVLVEKREGKE